MMMKMLKLLIWDGSVMTRA